MLDGAESTVLLLPVRLSERREKSMRITSKGQVTIPFAIRKRGGFLPDTEVEFELKGSTVVVRRVTRAPRRGPRLVQTLRGKGTTRMSTDQIMALTRGR
jgi:bifunctional DNA-binding transcriptional regulator/antitoxin component of YhaV-PrlF toxin-antitoxin module